MPPPRMSEGKGIVGEMKDEKTWGKAKARAWAVSKALPKVVLWAEEEYGHSTPYFVKVIGETSDFRNHIRSHGCRLSLPEPFTRSHYLKMDREIVLEDAVDGRLTWKVLFRAEGYKEWTRGWPEFSQQNNLQCGNVIVFALVSQSRFIFTLFNDEGCQIIHPSGAMQKNKLRSEGKPIPLPVNCGKTSVSSQWRSPSCPIHDSTRMKRPKLEIQEDGANIVSHVVNRSDDFPVEYTGQNKSRQASPQKIGVDKACQAAVIQNLKQVQPNKRKFSSFAHAAQNNHHICIHMGSSCGLHHEEKPKIQPLSQTLDQSEDSDLLEQCQTEIEQIQVAESSTSQEERTLPEKTISKAHNGSSNTSETSDDQPMEAHLDPILSKFTSKRRVVTKMEKREAIHAASRYSRTLRRPNCIMIMKKDQVYKEFIIELPRALVLLGGTVEFPQPPLTLVDSTGRSWEMQWYVSGRHRVALVPKDWAKFTVHHFLEEGDALVFETTDIEALIILVRIFRVVDIPDKLGTDDIYTHYSVESSF